MLIGVVVVVLHSNGLPKQVISGRAFYCYEQRHATNGEHSFSLL